MESDSDDNSYKTEILEDLIEDPLELQYERVKTKTEMDEQDLPVSEQVEVDTETNDEQCEKLQESRVRASHQQFCALLELMERYGDLAKPYPGVQGRVRSELLWKKLTTILNSIDGGVTKTVEKWKRVWADWKCKSKKKAEKIHVDASAGDKLTLTTYENRVLEVMCRAVVGPPYKEDELYNFQISQSTQPSTPSPEDHIDFELLSENDSPRLQTEDIKSKIEVVEHEVVEPRTNYEQVEVKTEPMGEQCEHTQQDSPRMQNANIKIKIEVVEHGPRTNGEQVEVKTEPTDKQNQQGSKEEHILDKLVNLDVSDYEDIDDNEAEDEEIVEDEEPRDVDSEWEESDDEPLSNFNRPASEQAIKEMTWSRSENFDNTLDYETPIEELPSDKNSYEYFSRYIPPSFFDTISTCTNMSIVNRTGKSLNTTPREVRTFIGCTMAIGILGLPRIKMFWADDTRMDLVAENITRNRYFNIRSNIKVVDDCQVSEGMKEVDRFWKIRPIVAQIEKACRDNPRSQNVAIDEQLIPFAGKEKLKGKMNPEGIKVFVMANSNGFPLDLYLYQGQETSIDSALYPMPEKIDLGGRAVLKLADTLPPKTSIYIDSYFTSIALLDSLRDRNMNGTGLLKKTRVPEYSRPNERQKSKSSLITDRLLRKSGRGSYDCIVRQDKKIAVVKWFDREPIYLASTESAVQPLGACRRWSKTRQRYLDVPQPVAIKKYNTYVGGIDLLDRTIGKYAMRGRTTKWTVRAIFYFIDFAAASAWIEYRHDAVKLGYSRKNIMQYFHFKIDLAKNLIYGGNSNSTPSSPCLNKFTRTYSKISRLDPILPPSTSEHEGNLPTPSRKRKYVVPVTKVKPSEAQHLPICAKDSQSHRTKCRMKGCSQLTFVKCSTCNIFLCLNVNRNCFYDFHTNNVE